MDNVVGSVENETEEQILARALEESLRHYNEFELPRLSQITSAPEETEKENENEEIGGVDDWDCWDEWDVEQVDNAVKFEQSLVNDECFKEPNTFNKKKQNDYKQSADLMKSYLFREIVPKKTSISIGEIGKDGADGFDKAAGSHWIYPCNFPVREYQFHIVHSALFDNTLVSLPTGLGKTFIAAVVMYNFYRWFPMGKIIFLAPTRPLVAQQIHACYDIMGIPKEDTIELTGSKNATDRAKAWQEKRVFFATPQVAANDLATGTCPGELVRCVVVDEAHRAAGKHAICQTIRGLLRLRERSPGSRFRVLALSATPGRNVDSVISIVSTLQISKLELRDEQSSDVAPYTFQRNVETVVVPLGQQLTETRYKFLDIMNPYLERLIQKKLLYCPQKSKLNKFQILQARTNFRTNPPQRMDNSQRGLIEGDFAICITLTHALGLLLTHGQRTFMSFIQGIIDGERGTPVVRGRLASNIPLLSLLSDLKEKLGPANSMRQPAPDVSLSEGMALAVEGENANIPFVTSHPKMDRLKEIVIEHFEKHQRTGESTRIMIFCEYRDPVVEICNLLMCYWPLVKPMSFVGQASASSHNDPDVPGTSKGTKGFTQKQQLQAVRGFRDGGYNVLVSTCVGEEGLDIGEVDLIVCYDAPHASPLRLVQRMGRTGRKREGRVVTLVTQDWEEQKHKIGLRQKNTIVKSFMNSKILASSLCRNNARILPPGMNPECHMMPMITQEKNYEEETKGSKNKGKGKKGNLKDQLNANKKRKKAKTGKEGNISGEENNTGLESKEKDEDDTNPEEAVPSTSKGKGKGKTKKKSVKGKTTKTVKKGIQEFFNKQKPKATEAVIELEVESEDDDFVRESKQQSKALEELNDEVIIIDEDDANASHISITKESIIEDGVSNQNPLLPPDLLELDNIVTDIFGNKCCSCSKSDPAFKCSIIASHFNLQYKSQPSHKSPLLNKIISLDFLTAEVLINFDVAKEAKRVEGWRVESFIHPSIEGNEICNWENEFNFPSDEYLRDEHSSLPCTQEKMLTNKNARFSNEMSNVLEKNIGMNDTVESIEEKNGQSNSSSKNNCNNATKSLPLSPPEESLMWNVYGKKNKTSIIGNSHGFGNIISEDVNFEELFPDSNKSSTNQASSSNNTKMNKPLLNRNYPVTSSPTNHKVETLAAQSTVHLPSKPVSAENQEISLNNIIEDENNNGSQSITPPKLNEEKVITFNTSPHGSPMKNFQNHPFIIASSTPKVHRKNLFPTNACLTSPIEEHSKRPSDANFDLLPFDIDCFDHELFSPPDIESLSQKKQASPINQDALSQSSLVEGVENEIPHYVIPNFNLGWEDEFHSDASSDATFIELENCDGNGKTGQINEANGNCVAPNVKSISVPEIHPKVSMLKNAESIASFEEKSRDSSKGYVENSSEICNLAKKKLPCFKVQDRHKEGEAENKSGNHMYNWSNNSFTVTQMVDKLACQEHSSEGQENQKVTLDKRKAESMQHKVNSSHEFDPITSNKNGHVDNITKQIENNKSDVMNNKIIEECIGSPLEKNVNHNTNEGLIIKVNSKQQMDESLSKEINFDIGDEAFLDISADLFAEDDTEDWLRESGEIHKDVQPASDKMKKDNGSKTAVEKSDTAVMCSKDNNLAVTRDDIDMKTKQSNGYKNNQSADSINHITSKHEGEKIFRKPNNFFLPNALGWNGDGWLTKVPPTNKKKLSLGLQNNKEHIEQDSRSKNTTYFSIPGETSKVNKTNNIECDDEVDFNFKSCNTGPKTSKASNWIDEITTEKVSNYRIQERETDNRKVVYCNDLKKTSNKACDTSPDLANSEDEAINFSAIIDKYTNLINSTEVEKGCDIKSGTGDKAITKEPHLGKNCQGSANSVKLERKISSESLEDFTLNVNTTIFSRSSDKSIPKIEEANDVITLSSEDSNASNNHNFGDVTNFSKSSSLREKNSRTQVDDDFELIKNWSEFGSNHGENNNHDSSDEESNDDFECFGPRRGQKRRTIGNSSKGSSISPKERSSVRPKPGMHSRRCMFLDSQAEESFIETRGLRKLSSDDEEDDDLKGQSQYYDPSFINDGLPNSQEDEIDIHAKYLQSVKSPRNQKFKIPHLPELTSDQENPLESTKAYGGDPSDSCYLNDSFCVDGESDGSNCHEDKESTTDELEILEAILSEKVKKSRKRKKEEITISSEDEIEIVEMISPPKRVKSSAVIKKKPKRKRIVIQEDSSDNEEQVQPSGPPAKKISLGSGNASESGVKFNEKGSRHSNFKEDAVEPKVSKECKPISTVKDNRELLIQNTNRNTCVKSSDTRAFSEKRMGNEKVELSKRSKYESICDEFQDNLLEIGHKPMTAKEGRVSEHMSVGVTNEEREVKAVQDMAEDIANTWASDLFDFDIFDDGVPAASSDSTSTKMKQEINPVCNAKITESSVNEKVDKLGSVNVPLKEKVCDKFSYCSNKEKVSVTPTKIDKVNKLVTTECQSKVCSTPGPSYSLSISNNIKKQSGNSFQSAIQKPLNEPKSKNQETCPIIAKSSPVPVHHLSPSSSSPQSVQSSSGKNNHKIPPDIENVVLVSPVEACRASEVVSALRVISKVRVVIFSPGGSVSIPYALGRNLCLFRFSSSELGRGNKIAETLQAAHKLYKKVAIIVEWGEENLNDSKKKNVWPQKMAGNWNSSSATISSSACMALINIGEADINVLHSSGKVESAKIIAELARHYQTLELKLGLQPVVLPKVFQSSDPKLKFYASLAGVNPFQALYLLQIFPKIKCFLEKCTSGSSIHAATGLDLNKSLQLHKVLANVHISDT